MNSQMFKSKINCPMNAPAVSSELPVGERRRARIDFFVLH
jgi:hypothetical protein